jgi:hypothetical protein
MIKKIDGMPNAHLIYLYFLIGVLLSMIYRGFQKPGETLNRAGLQSRFIIGLFSYSRAPTKIAV